ncbi:hypothetical protein [Alkalihalobacillus pseudalcaliphilus]|uniref:hypothetical protein n=1 Tax=Alkalihalobacillus pseudalcaliphilus TaxID=79884 RepID=UPI00064D8870|nr:hypothetical protein [Alkalihalobacillus pseudalcaliphilus]KMK75537.1 hypothetical protein AB990_09575 [Alkalihalobacillus pseudalcaliphilus]
MIEALINYGILFIFIILFAGLVVLAKKYPIIATLGKGLRNGFIIAFAFAMLIVFLIVYSFLAFLVMTVFSFAAEPAYFINGEAFNPLLVDNEVAKIIIPYAIFYLIVYFGSSLGYVQLNLNVWVHKALVFFTTVLATTFLFPIIVNSLFANIHVTFLGGFYFILFPLVIQIKQLIRREHRAYHRYRRRKWRYFTNRLYPWLKTGKDPGKNDGYKHPTL